MSQASTVRLFVGMFPDPAVRKQLAVWRDAWNWPRSATPVRTSQLHLTLHFIGDVERERVPAVADALHVPFDQFEMSFGRAQLWPHGVAVLEPLGVPEPLLELHAALRDVLGRFDLPPDARAYRPHVTLARRATAAVPPLQGPAFVWNVDRYALMESALGLDGGYTTIREFPGNSGSSASDWNLIGGGMGPRLRKDDVD